jgi:transposase
MLGPAKTRRLDEPIAVSLDALVPTGHFYRHLEATLDLGFVREWVRERYAERGRPGIDPVVFFKLQLVMFFEGIRSERQLVETASLNLAHRWYLGYALDEPLPDHSSLTCIRQRLGVAIFERFFDQVVDRCQDAGLVWGRELFFDATKVQADADLDSLVPRFYHAARTHLGGLFADEAARAGAEAPMASTGDLPAGVVRLPDAPVAEGPAPTDGPPWRLLEERRLDPDRPTDQYERLSAWRVSPTDPDATPMRTGGHASLGYHDHYVVDGGKARIILAALVTPADVMENVPMRDLLWRVCFRRKLRPHHVTADTTYATGENIAAIEGAGIRAYVPLADWDRKSFYGPSRFTYDPERDEMRCPEGQPLRRYTAKFDVEATVYRADAAVCNACPVKAACTASPRGRTVQRSFYADSFERVAAYRETAAYQKAMRKRQVWIEPLFAEAKDWHGLRRFRLRGLANVNCQGLLVAAGQNLKRLLAAAGWGGRHAPCGSLLALLT